jgi:hypothetical protein
VRVWALLGALLPLLGGFLGRDASDPSEAVSRRPPAERPAGFCVADDDFYVWDEDPAEARRWASELAASRRGERLG